MTVITYKNVKRPIIPPGDLPLLALFARGEQGAWYDPSDLFNYAMERGPELADMAAAVLSGTAERTADGIRLSGIGASTGAILFPDTRIESSGRRFEVEIEYTTATGLNNERPVIRWGSTITPPISPYATVMHSVSGGLRITTHASLTTDATITRISVRELSGIARATMFQDAEGSIPVTGVEQPVGLILDKSGNGNHASQLTVPARPTLSAKHNMLSNSVYVGGERYTVQNLLVEPAGESLGMPFTKLTSTSGGTNFRTYSKANHVPQTTYTTSVFFRRTEGDSFLRLSLDGAGSVQINTKIPESFPASCVHIEDDVWRLYYTATSGATTGGMNAFIYLMGDVAANVTPEAGMYVEVAGFQVEAGSELSRYQRVTSTTDYDWQGWPLYLRHDGVDDSLRAEGDTGKWTFLHDRLGSVMLLSARWHTGNFRVGTQGAASATVGVMVGLHGESLARSYVRVNGGVSSTTETNPTGSWPKSQKATVGYSLADSKMQMHFNGEMSDPAPVEYLQDPVPPFAPMRTNGLNAASAFDLYGLIAVGRVPSPTELTQINEMLSRDE